jgi:transcriptional regulator with XRE-family HTH domain
MERVSIRRDLRSLIRLSRDTRGLTQKDAAALAGNISDAWWKQIEGGRAEYATAGMLARMCYAVGVTPDQLRNIDEGHIADLVEEHYRLIDMHRSPNGAASLVEYLMSTPGMTDEQRAVLVATAQALLRPSGQ